MIRPEHIYILKRLHSELNFYKNFAASFPETKSAMQEQLAGAFSAMTTTTIYLDMNFYSEYKWFFDQWRKKIYTL